MTRLIGIKTFVYVEWDEEHQLEWIMNKRKTMATAYQTLSCGYLSDSFNEKNSFFAQFTQI